MSSENLKFSHKISLQSSRLCRLDPCHVSTQEHGHVLHEGAEVKDGHEDGEERAPHAGPEIERHEFEVASYCKVVDHQSVGQERASCTQDGQGLPSKG